MKIIKLNNDLEKILGIPCRYVLIRKDYVIYYKYSGSFYLDLIEKVINGNIPEYHLLYISSDDIDKIIKYENNKTK